MKRTNLPVLLLLILSASFLSSQSPATKQAEATAAQSATAWADAASDEYWVHPDRIYGTAGNSQLKLDVWQQHTATTPKPTVIYIHGGGWIFGDRTGAVPQLLPYLARGWNAVNVEYRMASTSLAPAAVEDARCALRWVLQNGKQYGIDTSRLVVTGHSAGGHLALMMGMLDPAAGLDANCPTMTQNEPMKVAAIVNWYGPTDVADLLDGPNWKNYAEMWLGPQPDRMAIAKRVSPLTYIRPGVPPVISVHGDADDVVPYSHAVRLHEGLAKAGVKNKLITVHGGKHGMFKPEEYKDAYGQIFEFLEQVVGSEKSEVRSKK